MNLGAQNRTKVIVSGALTTLALLLICRSILNLEGPSVPLGSTATQTTSQETATVKPGKNRKSEYHSPFDPTLNFARLQLSEGKLYEGTGRNLFSVVVERAKQKERSQPRPSPPDPTTRLSSPPFALTCFGFAGAPNAPKTIFLSKNSDLFIGSEGDIVDRRYKIIRVAPETVDIEDLLENSSHTLVLQQE